MRFELNQILFGVFFFKQAERPFPFYSTPLLYDDNMPDSIHFVRLEVTEHQKVLGEWDAKDSVPQYDGYKLIDDDGNLYFNQFPRASYGQTSDEGNRRFNLDRASRTEDFRPLSYHLLTDTLSNIYKGIEDLSEIKEGEERYDTCVAKKAQLEELAAKIVKEFHETYPEYELTSGKEKIWEESSILFWRVNINVKESVPE